ncbi:hypothetical protein MMC17_009662 [Xylographa soralifera]|nr:hypothetical protein [Xylographa soralifera]
MAPAIRCTSTRQHKGQAGRASESEAERELMRDTRMAGGKEGGFMGPGKADESGEPRAKPDPELFLAHLTVHGRGTTATQPPSSGLTAHGDRLGWGWSRKWAGGERPGGHVTRRDA